MKKYIIGLVLLSLVVCFPAKAATQDEITLLKQQIVLLIQQIISLQVQLLEMMKTTQATQVETSVTTQVQDVGYTSTGSSSVTVPTEVEPIQEVVPEVITPVPEPTPVPIATVKFEEAVAGVSGNTFISENGTFKFKELVVSFPNGGLTGNDYTTLSQFGIPETQAPSSCEYIVEYPTDGQYGVPAKCAENPTDYFFLKDQNFANRNNKSSWQITLNDDNRYYYYGFAGKVKIIYAKLENTDTNEIIELP